ncbi:MAG: hypothetical protein ACKVQR_20565 [Aquabacterium sp.]
MATKASLDKDQQKLVDQITKQAEACSAWLHDPRQADMAPLVKQRDAIVAKKDAAIKAGGAKLTASLKALVVEINALEKKAKAVGDVVYAAERCKAGLQDSRGMLAELMLEIGQIKTGSLCEKFAAELKTLNGEQDKLAKSKPTWDLLDVINVKFPARIQETLARVKVAQPLSDWLQGTYKPMALKTEAAIAAVPQERVRRVLAVEIDFIEADGRPFIAKVDLGGLKGATVSRLQALDRQAARMKALWASLDREMVRVGGLIKDAGAPKDLAGWLAALAKEKAAGWPKAGTAELLDKVVDAFEKDLAELAQTAKRGVAQAAGR